MLALQDIQNKTLQNMQQVMAENMKNMFAKMSGNFSETQSVTSWGDRIKTLVALPELHQRPTSRIERTETSGSAWVATSDLPGICRAEQKLW
jgi:acyl-homoserine lactone acylase PvdQ